MRNVTSWIGGIVVGGIALLLLGVGDAAAGIGGWVPDGKSQWVGPIIIGILLGAVGIHLYQRFKS